MSTQRTLFDAPEQLAPPVQSERALLFSVHGVPTTQGSGKPLLSHSTGRPFIKPDHGPALKAWRQDVARTALAARAELGLEGVLIEGAVRLVLTFRMPRRKSWPRRARLEHVAKRPDFDKLTRAVSDALTGVVWIDDSQVTTALILKRPARLGEPPGVDVAVGPDHDDRSD